VYKSIILAGIFFCLCLQVFPQEMLTSQEAGPDANVLYRKDVEGAVVIHSQGFGLNYRRGTHVNGINRKFIEVELVTMNDPKETKTYNSTYPNSKGFYYGELNSVLVLRAGVGYQKVLFGKAERERKSVEIRYSVFVGPSLAFAKPIYLEIIQSSSNPGEFQLTTERYDPSVHNLSNIYDKASYLTGVSQTKIYPGAYAKFALSVEYSDRHNNVRAIETGVVIDGYPKAVPIMATEKNYPYFLTLYIDLIIGKKWY